MLADSLPSATAFDADSQSSTPQATAPQLTRALEILALAERTVRWEDDVRWTELQLFASLYRDVLRELPPSDTDSANAEPAAGALADRSALLQLRAQACAAVRRAQQAQGLALPLRARHGRRYAVALLASLLIGAFSARASLADWFDWGNVSRGKAWKASSRYASHVARSGVLGNFSGPFFFHTDYENSPWIEIDLGADTPVHSVAIVNRTDCCANRAAPLVIETSREHQHWRVVATQRESFDRWHAWLDGQLARWLRVRVLRESNLHLKAIVVRK